MPSPFGRRGVHSCSCKNVHQYALVRMELVDCHDALPRVQGYSVHQCPLCGFWPDRRGEAMPRPYQATPRVAHRSEAMPRPQSFVEAPPGPGDACSGEAMPRPYDIHIREHESGAGCGRPVGRPYDPVFALVGEQRRKKLR